MFIRLFQLAALAFIVVLFLNVIYASAGNIMKIEEKKASLVSQIQEQERTIERLEQEIEFQNTDAYIEKEAREQGFIKSNEIIYKITR